MNRRTLLPCILALPLLVSTAPSRAETFSPPDTIIGSAGVDKEKADEAGRLIAARAHDALRSVGAEGGFRVQPIRLAQRPRDASPLGSRIADSARLSAEGKGWSYPGAPWVAQGSLSRAGDDAILRLRLVRDVDGAVLPLHPILLVGMGPRSWMGPISSLKPW